MRVYTIHLPPDVDPSDPRAFERAMLVRDGFNFAAFFFSVLWMLYHRLWLAALLTLVLLVAVGFGVDRLEITAFAAFLVQLMVAILIGLEASSLRRWTYARRGWHLVDVVAASDYTEADARACARFVESRSPARDRVEVVETIEAPLVEPAPVEPAPVPPAPVQPAPARVEEIPPFGLAPRERDPRPEGA